MPFKKVQILYDSKEYERMFETISFLSKKRGQPKKAMIEMVQLCMSFIPHLELETRLKLITTLKDVCDKKIFLEVLRHLRKKKNQKIKLRLKLKNFLIYFSFVII